MLKKWNYQKQTSEEGGINNLTEKPSIFDWNHSLASVRHIVFTWLKSAKKFLREFNGCFSRDGVCLSRLVLTCLDWVRLDSTSSVVLRCDLNKHFIRCLRQRLISDTSLDKIRSTLKKSPPPVEPSFYLYWQTSLEIVT